MNFISNSLTAQEQVMLLEEMRCTEPKDELFFKCQAKHLSKHPQFSAACRLGYLDLVKIFHANGVEPEALIYRKSGYTLLHQVSGLGQVKVAEWLCKTKININALDFQRKTALDYAVQCHHLAVGEVLFAHNAKINIMKGTFTVFKDLNEAEPTFFTTLPAEISSSIINRLKFSEVIGNCRLVCKKWYQIMSNHLCI